MAQIDLRIPEHREDLAVFVDSMRIIRVIPGNTIYESYKPAPTENDFPFHYLGSEITILIFASGANPIRLAKPVRWLKKILREKVGSILEDQKCLDCQGKFKFSKVLPPGSSYEVNLKTIVHLLGHLLLPTVKSAIIGPPPLVIEELAYFNRNNFKQVCLAFNARCDLTAVGLRLAVLLRFFDHLVKGREAIAISFLRQVMEIEDRLEKYPDKQKSGAAIAAG